MSLKLLQYNKISKELVDSVSDSFNRLPKTTHKDGEYRLRRYSVVEIHSTFWNAKNEPVLTRLEHRDFIQGEDLNKHQGGMVRSFEEIEEETIQSEGFHEICFTFKNANNLIDGQEIEIHQMRVVPLTRDSFTPRNEKWSNTTPVSPEGTHQDGFDHIAMVGINRQNIAGGGLMVFVDKESKMPILDKELQAGEMMMLDDRELWHNARDVWAINERDPSFADWFILCAKK